VFLEATTDTVQTIEMTNLWGSMESPQHGHGCTADVVVAERDCPLERSDEALVVFDVFGTRFFSDVKFGMIVFVKRRCVFLWRSTKDGFTLIDDAFAASLGSPCKCAIVRVTTEISKKMAGHLPNSLEFVLAASWFSKEGTGVFHHHSQVIGVDAHTLTVRATVFHPNIGISFARKELHCKESIGKLLMETRSTGA
jgi:hypothetical protein